MSAKRIQVSVDAGTTWKTIPGAQGDFTEELATVNDTVFGQQFESNEVSIGQWNVGGNGYFKGVSGYQANLKQQGSATTMTAEACSLVSGKTYQITNTTKQIIDYFSSLTVFDNAVDKTNQVASIDYLSGTITFLSTYTVTGPVTVTGKYIPTTTIAKGRSFTLNMTCAEKDTTTYEAARANGGFRTFDYGLRSVTMDMTGVYDITNGASAAMQARTPIVVEVSPDNSSTTFFRGYFKRVNHGQSGDVGALEEETQKFNLWVPDGSLVVAPFDWYFGVGSALNSCIQDILNSWQNLTPVNVRYQNDPSVAGSGHTGSAIVTECSLKNNFDGLNEFTFGFRGTGAHTAV